MHATLGTSWGRTWLRTLCLACSGVVLFYSVMVLMQVAWMGTIGVRCLFGTDVEEEVPADFLWTPTANVEGGAKEAAAAPAAEAVDRPHIGDALLSIGPIVLRQGSYSDYIQALRGLSDQVGRTVKVTWKDSRSQEIHAAQAVVRYPPTRSYVLSCVWFLQELLIFGVGARVFWKRPGDVSARLFFVLCLVTVGAYMGGYHWTEIVVRPALIYPFVFFALLVPVVNLHFFLVFPRQNPVLLRHRRLVLIVLYGIPVVFLAAIWGSMYMSHWFRLYDSGVRTTAAERVIRGLALCYIAIATLIFVSLYSLPGLQLSLGPHPGGEEPGQVDLAGVAHRLCADWLPALASLERHGEPGPRQRRLADGRGSPYSTRSPTPSALPGTS